MFTTTYTAWLHNVNTRLLWYCGLTLAELPQLAPALPTWYAGGASAWIVAQVVAGVVYGDTIAARAA